MRAVRFGWPHGAGRDCHRLGRLGCDGQALQVQECATHRVSGRATCGGLGGRVSSRALARDPCARPWLSEGRPAARSARCHASLGGPFAVSAHGHERWFRGRPRPKRQTPWHPACAAAARGSGRLPAERGGWPVTSGATSPPGASRSRAAAIVPPQSLPVCEPGGWMARHDAALRDECARQGVQMPVRISIEETVREAVQDYALRTFTSNDAPELPPPPGLVVLCCNRVAATRGAGGIDFVAMPHRDMQRLSRYGTTLALRLGDLVGVRPGHRARAFSLLTRLQPAGFACVATSHACQTCACWGLRRPWEAPRLPATRSRQGLFILATPCPSRVVQLRAVRPRAVAAPPSGERCLVSGAHSGNCWCRSLQHCGGLD